MNIYVGNLDFKVSEDQIHELFSGKGQVESAKLIKDSMSGRSKGFAFVEMPNDNEATRAIDDLNGQEFNGRAMVVKKAIPKEKSSFKPKRNFNSERY
jgi:RNA recognition motif-containing protein